MMSPLSFIVMLLVMIIIPTILYTLFFLIKCPPTPLDLLRTRTEPNPKTDDKKGKNDIFSSNTELVVAVGSKEAECPVCLSVFNEGEEVKQLKICKHFFHQSCIDKWLSNHYNCPVCRAFVAGLPKPKERESHLRRDVGGTDDHWQGLPDSAGLI